MLVSNYLPRQGGAEYAVHHLTTYLIALGHEPVVLAGYDSAAGMLDYPYPVSHCPRMPLIGLEKQRYLHACRHLKRQRFDVIHAHIAWEAGYVGAQLKNRFGVPLVLTAHGGDVQVVPEIDYGLCLDPEKREKVRVALKSADRVTAVSRRMRAAITSLGVEPSCIRDVGYGTQFDRISTLRTEDLRGQLGLSQEDFVVLSVGRNARVKDIPTFIDGLRLAAASNRRIKCILAGPDDSIQALVQEANLQDAVRVLGRIPRGYDPKKPTNVVFETPYPEMVGAYRAADVFVATSYIESFNTSALDAFACGRPVIITDTQGFMDLLVEGENGYSIPRGDSKALATKLLRLAADRDRCKRMGAKAKETAQAYDWSLVAKRYLDVYGEAIKEGKLKPAKIR